MHFSLYFRQYFQRQFKAVDTIPGLEFGFALTTSPPSLVVRDACSSLHFTNLLENTTTCLVCFSKYVEGGGSVSRVTLYTVI